LWAFLENRIKNYLRGKLERRKLVHALVLPGVREMEKDKKTAFFFFVCVTPFLFLVHLKTFLVLFTFFVTG